MLYAQVLKDVYGMLQAALMCYKKFIKGFEFNLHDPSIMNQMKKWSQHTIRFPVDDLKSSHVMTKVNDNFEKWLQRKYGGHGKVKAH